MDSVSLSDLKYRRKP